jgi:hypothetical protein
VPTARNLVRFTLDGPAEWRGGIAQGDSRGKTRPEAAPPVATTPAEPGTDAVTHFAGTARDEDNYILSPDLPVEAGINRVLLRAATHGGTVRLSAAAEGLNGATLNLATVAPAPAAGGLSTDFPDRSQPGLLSRGPTPQAATYRISRATYSAIAIKAGSAQADTAMTTDDNELTRWTSDGRPDSAWIEYRFDRPVTLNAIDLKLVGWRSRAYPLRVTLDGREIWKGETERQLGYAILDFAPSTGRVLRIQQTGPVVDRDAFGAVVELNNARAAGDTGADAVPPGWRLGIVEAEFHGPVGP